MPEPGRRGLAGRERLAVDFAQSADKSIPMFPADLAVLVAMAVIDTHH
jgi:hypothetical protein